MVVSRLRTTANPFASRAAAGALLLFASACHSIDESVAASGISRGAVERACAPQAAAIDEALQVELDTVVDASVTHGFAGQVVVMKDGSVVYSRAVGFADLAGTIPVTGETLFHVASLTKYFTAVLTLMAVEEGRLTLTASASDLFAGTPLAARDFTIADLLAHRSGLKSTYAAESETTREGAIAAIAAAISLEDKTGDVRKAEAPRAFQYSNDGYDLLAIVLERIYGKSFEALFREKIATPACLEHFGFWGETPLGDPNVRGQPLEPADEKFARRNYGMIGSAGLLITSNDLVQFERALAHGRILSASSLEELRKPRGAIRVGEALYGAFLIDTPLGKAISARGSEDWGDNGYLNDYAACELVVAIVTSRGPAEESGEPLFRDRLIEEIGGSLERLCASKT